MSEVLGSESYLRLVSLVESEPAALWSKEETDELWTHLLEAPLVKCIEELGVAHALRCDALCDEANPHVRTVSDLIHHPHPSVELLTFIGMWMERTLSDVDELLPRDVALSLFNASIVLARLRCNTRLIAGSDIELARKADWVARRTWIDVTTRNLMQNASIELGGIDSQEMR